MSKTSRKADGHTPAPKQTPPNQTQPGQARHGRSRRAQSDVRLPDPTRVSGNELRKSGETRTRIMQAAIDCLADTGYAGISTTSVAERAGLTRAAMLYHFPSRMALIEAVVHYVMRERIHMFNTAYNAMSQEARTNGEHIDIYWEQVQHRLFKAFGELSTAARTNADLAAILTPAVAEFDRARREAAQQIFPAAFIKQPYFDLRRDVTRYLLEGLARLDAPAYNPDQRRADIIGFLKALATEPEGRQLLLRALEKSRGHVTES